MKFFPFHIKKISHKLTIVYALLFFIALVFVNAATLLSIGYYMNQTSVQQLELIDNTIKKEVTVFDDTQRIDLKNIAQMTDNVDINLIFKDKLIYNTEESYNALLSTDFSNKITKFEEVGEKRLLYLNDQLILADGNVLNVQIIKDMDNEWGY